VKPLSAWQTNWTGSSGRATTAYNEGVQAYNGDWAGATTRQQAVMQQNWLASLPTWAARVNAVGTAGWKTATTAKSPNYGTGFQAGGANYGLAAQKIYNALSTIVPSLPPRGTYDQNKQRATALMDALHAQRGQLGAK
jgi:hypothetical protein